jgi:hypothetical protein
LRPIADAGILVSTCLQVYPACGDRMNMRVYPIRSLSLLLGSLAAASCVASPNITERDRATASLHSPLLAPEWGWRCSARFDVEGRRVTIWRDFDASGKPSSYQIQTFENEPNGTYWTIGPRPDGAPKGEASSGDTGRSEAEVLRNGPDYVHINYPWHTEVTGPVYAHFWGDGTYVGAERLFSAKEVRRYTERDGKMGGLSGGLSQGPIMKALYGSQAWMFKVTDATGKELTSGIFRPPDLARAVTEYRVSRAEIEKLVTEFRTDFETRIRGSAICAAHDDPANGI